MLELVHILYFLVIMAATYALPVAIPTVLLTEYRSVGEWKLFAVAGLVLGLILGLLLTEFPIEATSLAFVLMLTIASLLGAMTYWLIAWKLFPPKPASVLVK